jgi:hypothetical protein
MFFLSKPMVMTNLASTTDMDMNLVMDGCMYMMSPMRPTLCLAHHHVDVNVCIRFIHSV